MMAVYERDVLGSGRGQHIDMSLFEPLARLHEGHMLEYSALGLVRERLGNRSLSSAPRNAYKAADGRWVALSASAQPIFERLMEAIGTPELIRDSRFLTNHDRIQNSLALDAVIEGWISQRDRDEAIDTLSRSGAAIGPIYSVAELLDDPQVKARGSFESHHDPDLGEIVVPSVVAKFSRTPGSVRHLGQHKGEATQEVLKDLGYSDEEIKDLQESGAV
jgi:formyl-CoA transferase